MIASAPTQKDFSHVGFRRPTRVSSVSLWTDHQWKLDIPMEGIPNNERVIKWDFQLPDGSDFSRLQHDSLRDAAKAFLWSMYSDSPAGHKSPKIQSLPSLAKSLRLFICWMNSYGFLAFRSVNNECLSDFAEYIRNREGRNGGLAESTIYSHLQIPVLLYKQREKLIDSLTFEPFNGQALHTGASTGSIPWIPDEVAVPLYQHALKWIVEYSPAIEDMSALVLDTYRGCINRGTQSITAYYHAKAVIRSTKAKVAHLPVPVEKVDDVAKLFNRLADACFIVIAGFVGMRFHEIAELKEDCILSRTSADGLLRVWFLRSCSHKTSSEVNGREMTWTAGSTPIDSEEVPPAIKAVQVLTRLKKVKNDVPGQPLYSALFAFRGLVAYRQQANYGRFTNEKLTERLDAFVQSISLPRDWKISLHQFRKTFARFVARMDKSNLRALSRHFHHTSLAMTDGSYVGGDFELSELVSEFQQEELAYHLQRLIASPALAGRMADAVATHGRSMIDKVNGDTTKLIELIVSDTDITIHSCDWGFCLYRQELSACKGGHKSPNYANRNVSVCSRCPNLVITKDDHKAFWLDRKRLHEGLLLHAANDLQLRVIRARLDECQNVLDQLEREVSFHGNIQAK